MSPQQWERVKELFLEAIGQPAEARHAFVRARCCDAAELIELDSMLLAHDRNTPAAQGTPAGSGDTLPPSAPRSVGHYKLLEQIGEGGMGVVYLAEQEHPVRRRVALKIIRPGMDSASVIARFQAERQALAMMEHPSIARVYEAGATDTGHPYFAMELVEGVPITDYCDASHLTPRERLGLFVQVCRAVQHAHTKGVIHRDLKPTNILVTLHDGIAVPKIIDFGIAKATGGAAQQLTDKTRFTHVAQMVGTPLYMSPEQAEFSGLDVDTRSDIYGLGVLLYELLTGTTPFDKKRLGEAALDEVRRIIREEEPPRPSTRLSVLLAETMTAVSANRKTDPGKLGRSMRGELDWIVMKALEKDRTRRYETASSLATDVQRYLNDEAVQASPPSAWYRFQKFARRNKGPLMVGATIALVLLAATVFSMWQAVRATRALAGERAARQEAKAEAKRATTEAAISQKVIEFLRTDLLAQADGGVPVDRFNEPSDELKLLTVLSRASSRIKGAFPDQPLVEAALRQTIGETYDSLRDAARAGPHFRRAVELRRAQLGEEHPDTLTSMMCLAGATDDAELASRVLELGRRTLGNDHPDTLTMMRQLAAVLRRKGDLARAIPLYRECLTARQRVLGDDDYQTAYTKWGLGIALASSPEPISQAQAGEIEAMFRQAQSSFRKDKSAGGRSVKTQGVTLELGHFLTARERYEDADTVLQEGLVWLQQVPAAPPEWTMEYATELDNLHRIWGQPERAAEWARKRPRALEPSLRRSLRLLNEQPDDIELLNSHATLLVGLHRYDEAEAVYREAIRLKPGDAARHRNLGSVFGRHRRLTDAAAAFTEAFRLGPQDASGLKDLGDAYAEVGMRDKAAAAYRRSLEATPDDMNYFYGAALFHHENDQENYRRACVALLDHFGKTDDIHSADITLKVCALAPGFGADANQVMNLADAARFKGQTGGAREWFELSRAMAHYRANRFESAADIIVHSVPLVGSQRDATALSILAMSQHRLGKVDEARKVLSNAQRIISTKMPRVENGEMFGNDWHDWLHAEILCREAEQVLKTSSPSTQKS